MKMMNFLNDVIKSGVLMLLMVGTACTSEPHVPTPPASFPITLDRGGEIFEYEVKITDKYPHYTFGLQFFYNEVSDSMRIAKLLGVYEVNSQGRLVDTGLSLAIRIAIEPIDPLNKTPTFNEVISNFKGGARAEGSDYIRDMVTIRLSPGIYKVHIENMRAAPATKEISVAIGVNEAYRGK